MIAPTRKRNPIAAFCIGIVAPLFIIWLAWKAHPIIYHKDVLGSVHDFSDCTVVKLDKESGALFHTNETIEIAQVDHDIQLV